MSFKIIVCVKQVPDVSEIKVDKENGILITEDVNMILNMDDANALEEALTIKDLYTDSHVTVITMGAPEAKDVLMECLALGADDAILITDSVLEGSDSLITAMVLSAAIKKLGNYDLVFTGRHATGGETSQVGPQLAEMLNLPQYTDVISLKIEQNMKSIVVKKLLNDKCETVRLNMPCLLTAIKELNKPRSMSLKGILEAEKKDIKTWSIADIGISAEAVMNSSPTNVVHTFIPSRSKKCNLTYAQDEEKVVKSLLQELQGKIKYR